ncbi:serine/threonine-protein kinase [Coleofasciculus sp. FACHB-1120]|uniref:serine/threonine-protein kinase n=1 Tax=Coleofasciculus sp. FACHB-1120 TaxID=2692783 RepID=UPI001684BB23|nr:serine/threonine-protein kinase [Coleofasciculus sp. FACHB-1120]MBD2741810.1 serine/threonine protein kinase [Coleofasciculus sp. FACHB-1120]
MSYCLNPACPNPQNPSDTKFCLTCGTKLLLKDRYRAIKPIGQGGFGRTFLAVDEDKPSKPRCVIKQFYPQAQGTSTVKKAVELFNQEAMRLDELGKHSQIPELLAYFTQDDRQYLVQEFIDGQNLAQELVQVGAFSEAHIRQLLSDLLSVLQFVHSQQVIHRDIKPENIIRRSRDRKLVLVDFGASKVATANALNQTGTSIGSPEYVAPEQARGRASFASDIYSLGVTCIHLLTQRSPFDLYDINEDAWIWRQYLTSKVSDSLGKILDKMLETAPSRRYQSAEAVLKDLNSPSAQVVTVISQTPATPAKPPVKSSPVTPPVANTPANLSKSQIDVELEALKAEIMGGGTSKNENQKSASSQPPSPNPTKSKNHGERQVDLELEELKSQFLGSPTPKKPPQS